MGPVAREMQARLTEALAPLKLEIIDDSHHHAGHAGHDARGESHFTVEIVSAAFTGQSRVNRQRLVNNALRELLANRIHALSIKTQSPEEAEL